MASAGGYRAKECSLRRSRIILDYYLCHGTEQGDAPPLGIPFSKMVSSVRYFNDHLLLLLSGKGVGFPEQKKNFVEDHQTQQLSASCTDNCYALMIALDIKDAFN